jgi:hypothetical protein
MSPCTSWVPITMRSESGDWASRLSRRRWHVRVQLTCISSGRSRVQRRSHASRPHVRLGHLRGGAADELHLLGALSASHAGKVSGAPARVAPGHDGNRAGHGAHRAVRGADTLFGRRAGDSVGIALQELRGLERARVHATRTVGLLVGATAGLSRACSRPALLDRGLVQAQPSRGISGTNGSAGQASRVQLMGSR